jgi:cell division inhibitor SepF
MAKNGSKRSFLDLFKVNDYNDEIEDDLFDDDDDDDFDEDEIDDEYESKPAVNASSGSRAFASATQSANKQPAKRQRAARPVKAVSGTNTNNNKLVSINGRSQYASGSQQVFVIKPEEFDDAQMIIDHLKGGQAIVINMEGIELSTAQRIIDFIAGACYSLDGSLQAISGNIFIAAPSEIYVSGDLRDELLSDASLSPELGRY